MCECNIRASLKHWLKHWLHTQNLRVITLNTNFIVGSLCKAGPKTTLLRIYTPIRRTRNVRGSYIYFITKRIVQNVSVDFPFSFLSLLSSNFKISPFCFHICLFITGLSYCSDPTK